MTSPTPTTFESIDSGFAAFLVQQSTAPEPERFVARNFRIDEHVPLARGRQYLARVWENGGITDMGTANDAHIDYVADCILRDLPASGVPKVIDALDVGATPETFRFPETLSDMAVADDALELVRVESVRSIAKLAGEDVDETSARLDAISSGAVPPGDDTWLRGLLARWLGTSPQRPLFAGVWEDVAEAFANAGDAWPDALRDTFGLAHHDPSLIGVPIPIAVFRYPIRIISRRDTTRQSQHAIHTPCVLDGGFWPYFVPAPVETSAGYAASLEAAFSREPAREVVHPIAPLQPEHFFKFGRITRAPSADLPTCRAAHLLQLRELVGRSTYAANTDGDIA